MSYGRIELCLLALKLCAWATTTTAQGNHIINIICYELI